MSKYEKLTRDQFAWFLDTTPNEESPTWELIGFGINEAGIEYNPQVETEKFIIHKNATSSHESNQKQSSITQKCYKGEPIFEYMNKLRDKSGDAVRGRILEVDSWNGTGEADAKKYPAKMTEVITPVTSFLGENAEIGYDIYFNGDPEEGTVTIANGTPTFVPSANANVE